MSELEETFAGQLRMLFMDHGWDYGAVKREYQFCPDRKWRADFAIAYAFAVAQPVPVGIITMPHDNMIHLLIEIEGGTRRGGRHNKHQGMTDDCYKYGAASALGYVLLRGTSQMVNDGTLLMMTDQVLRGELNIKDWKTT